MVFLMVPHGSACGPCRKNKFNQKSIRNTPIDEIRPEKTKNKKPWAGLQIRLFDLSMLGGAICFCVRWVTYNAATLIQIQVITRRHKRIQVKANNQILIAEIDAKN